MLQKINIKSVGFSEFFSIHIKSYRKLIENFSYPFQPPLLSWNFASYLHRYFSLPEMIRISALVLVFATVTLASLVNFKPCGKSHHIFCSFFENFSYNHKTELIICSFFLSRQHQANSTVGWNSCLWIMWLYLEEGEHYLCLCVVCFPS